MRFHREFKWAHKKSTKYCLASHNCVVAPFLCLRTSWRKWSLSSHFSCPLCPSAKSSPKVVGLMVSIAFLCLLTRGVQSIGWKDIGIMIRKISLPTMATSTREMVTSPICLSLAATLAGVFAARWKPPIQSSKRLGQKETTVSFAREEFVQMVLTQEAYFGMTKMTTTKILLMVPFPMVITAETPRSDFAVARMEQNPSQICRLAKLSCWCVAKVHVLPWLATVELTAGTYTGILNTLEMLMKSLVCIQMANQNVDAELQ